MKKRSKAFQEGYDYAYMLGRDDTKEIKEYFKQFDINPYTKKYEDLDLWTCYPYFEGVYRLDEDVPSKKQRKHQNDFEKGVLKAYNEMTKFNEELEMLDDPMLYTDNDNAWDAIVTMQDFLKWADGDKKKLQKYIDIYTEGLIAERKFFEEIRLRLPYEIEY